MQTVNQSPKDQQPQEQSDNLNEEQDSLQTGATEEDGSPVLDEEDLEENDLSEDQAEDVEWEGEGEEEGDSQEP